MNCSRWQRLVALSVSGDVHADQARKLDTHLEDCASCRKLEQQLQGDLDDVRALDAAGAEEMTLGSVRGAVMAQIDAKRLTAWVFGLPGPATVAATLVVAGLLAVLLPWGGDRGDVRLVESELPEVPPAVEADQSTVEQPGPEPEEESEPFVRELPAAEPVVHVPPTAGAESIQPPAPLRMVAAEPMTIKILTDDPDVVIYWIVEAKGEEENA